MLLLHPTARRRVDMRAGPVRGLQCAAWFDLCEPGLGLTIRPGLEMDYGKYNNFCGILKTKKWGQITDYVTKPSQIGMGDHVDEIEQGFMEDGGTCHQGPTKSGALSLGMGGILL